MFNTVMGIDERGEVFIRRSWFDLKSTVTYGFSLFCILAFSYYFLLPEISLQATADAQIKQLFIFLVIFCAIMSILFFYLIMANIFNCTRVTSKRGVIYTDHYPFSFEKGSMVFSEEIAELYVSNVIRTNYLINILSNLSSRRGRYLTDILYPKDRMDGKSEGDYINAGLYVRLKGSDSALICEFSDRTEANKAQSLISHYLASGSFEENESDLSYDMNYHRAYGEDY